jgi:hypothetical protein
MLSQSVSVTLALCVAISGPLQSQGFRRVALVSFESLDVGVVSDTIAGLQVFATTKANRHHPYTRQRFSWLRFDPSHVQAWLPAAQATLSAAPSASESGLAVWTLPIRHIIDEYGSMAVGRNYADGSGSSTYWLLISDSASRWQVEIGRAEVDSLFRLLALLAPLSRLDSTLPGGRLRDTVDTPVTFRGRLRLKRQPEMGSVVVQYVVGVNGRADPQSVLVLLASNKRLVDPARRAIHRFRFTPATRGGKPVPQLITHPLVFNADSAAKLYPY